MPWLSYSCATENASFISSFFTLSRHCAATIDCRYHQHSNKQQNYHQANDSFHRFSPFFWGLGIKIGPLSSSDPTVNIPTPGHRKVWQVHCFNSAPQKFFVTVRQIFSDDPAGGFQAKLPLRRYSLSLFAAARPCKEVLMNPAPLSQAIQFFFILTLPILFVNRISEIYFLSLRHGLCRATSLIRGARD